MLDKPTAPLEIARKELKKETIWRIRNDGYTPRAYLILDRWALNQPEDLRKLEAMGPIEFMLKLCHQQHVENHLLSSDTAIAARNFGMSDWEILEIEEIDTSLRLDDLL